MKRKKGYTYLALLILVLFAVGCQGSLSNNPVALGLDDDYKDYVKFMRDWRATALDAKEILGMEVTVMGMLLGGYVEMLPHDAYRVYERAKLLAYKTDTLTEEEKDFLVTWKLGVLSSVTQQLLDKYAPNILKTLKEIFL